MAYEAGLMPSEFRQATIAEITAVCLAHVRRECRVADARALQTACLMISLGHHRPGTTVESLMRSLLGRDPGTVPGQPDASRTLPEPEPEAFVEWLGLYVRAHGGSDLRQATAGA